MAEDFVNVPNLTVGDLVGVATFTDPSGKKRQVTVIGDSALANVASVKAPSATPTTAGDAALTTVLRPDSVTNDGGTAINGASMPTGGVGLTGWLSACWSVLSSILTKLNGSIAVTGTFWQAVQPVSGTFWQATQPVSLAAAVTVQGGNKPVGPSSLSAVQSAVGTSAVQVIGARTGGVGVGRCTVTLKNMGPGVVALGQSLSVTMSTGFKLNPGDTQPFDTSAAVFGVSDVAGNTVCVMETF